MLAALTRSDAAALLRVSSRTVRNWERGRVDAPYSAYALVLIAAGYVLPGEAWEGWLIREDALYSPEGLAFKAHEAAWWSLTCAMARNWLREYDEASAARFPASLGGLSGKELPEAVPQGSAPGNPQAVPAGGACDGRRPATGGSANRLRLPAGQLAPVQASGPSGSGDA